MQQRLATVVFGVLLGMPHMVAAQELIGLESIASRLKPGAKLSVISTEGEEVRARLDRVTASDLTVRVREKTVVLPASKIDSVRAHDSSWDGAGWGAAIGGAAGGLLAATLDGVSVIPLGAAFYGGIGLGVGWLIDSAQHPVVYKGGPQVTVRPHLSSFAPPGATKAGTRADVRATIAW